MTCHIPLAGRAGQSPRLKRRAARQVQLEERRNGLTAAGDEQNRLMLKIPCGGVWYDRLDREFGFNSLVSYPRAQPVAVNSLPVRPASEGLLLDYCGMWDQAIQYSIEEKRDPPGNWGPVPSHSWHTHLARTCKKCPRFTQSPSPITLIGFNGLARAYNNMFVVRRIHQWPKPDPIGWAGTAIQSLTQTNMQVDQVGLDRQKAFICVKPKFCKQARTQTSMEAWSQPFQVGLGLSTHYFL